MNEEIANEIVESIRGKFSSEVLESSIAMGEATVVIDSSQWITVAKWLAGEGGFSFLSDLCGVDWPLREPRFEVVCHLTDMKNFRRLAVKLPVVGEPPKIASVTSIWPTADWLERETFDMFGIVFEGHPDMTRILMPDEWEGYPLRKDYAMGKVPIEYKSISPGFAARTLFGDPEAGSEVGGEVGQP